MLSNTSPLITNPCKIMIAILFCVHLALIRALITNEPGSHSRAVLPILFHIHIRGKPECEKRLRGDRNAIGTAWREVRLIIGRIIVAPVDIALSHAKPSLKPLAPYKAQIAADHSDVP